MSMRPLRRTWDRLGERDPLWAVVSHPDKQGGRWEVEDFFKTGRAAVDEALALLDRLALTPSYSRALDFGCGVGRLSQALGTRFDAVVGVDVAPSMIELADRYNQMPDKVSYRLNDRPDLSKFTSGSFDLRPCAVA